VTGAGTPEPGEATLETVTSADGTRIAYRRGGAGPPLVLVHGSIADHTTTWRIVGPKFEERFTVHAMDRRGRGGSGDAPEYDLKREAEDIAAVVDSIGGPVHLVAHSFGGICALESALLTSRIRRLVLYEGVFLKGEEEADSRVIEKLEKLLDAGETEAMLVGMLQELVGMPREQVEVLRSQPEAWSVRLGNAPTVPRELRAIQRYTFDPARFREMTVPTLLLVGEKSPSRERKNAEGAARLLANARIEFLPGEQHLAMYTSPDLFVSEVVRFLEE
jgi:pimeloyl-ACP methyl ester carboxylesterase